MNPALLVLDPQNDFFEGDNPNLAEFRRVIPTINSAIRLFRQNHWLIVLIQHTSPKKPAGTHTWDIFAGFDFRPEDVCIPKTHANAFWQTDLDSFLRARQVDYVLVTGFLAEYCVLSTFRGARERGYRSAILKGSTASLKDEYTRFVLEISESVALDDFYATAKQE